VIGAAMIGGSAFQVAGAWWGISAVGALSARAANAISIVAMRQMEAIRGYCIAYLWEIGSRCLDERNGEVRGYNILRYISEMGEMIRISQPIQSYHAMSKYLCQNAFKIQKYADGGMGQNVSEVVLSLPASYIVV
jgi:hypothetical protein